MKKVLIYVLLLASTCMQAQDILPWPMDTVEGKVYYKYTVEKSIGLYRISKNFGVSQEAILLANPELRNRGLRYEEVIRIPTNLPATPKQAVVEQKPSIDNTELTADTEKKFSTDYTEPAESTAQEVSTDNTELTESVEQKPDTDKAEQTELTEWTALTEEEIGAEEPERMDVVDTVRLTFLLPLQAELAHRNPTIDRFYDFYTGALLALKHHEASYTDSTGLRHQTYYEVRTYDVGKDVRMINQLTDSNRLADADAIIGPAYNKQVEALSGYVREHQIPIMIPFLQQVPDMKGNPYMLKFNSSDEIQTHALMEYLDSIRTQINIVLVDAYANSSDYPQGIGILRDSIRNRHLPSTHTTIRQILADSVGLSLKDSVENILLFHSERYSNIQLLMPYLLSGKRGRRLTLLSQYAWQTEHVLLPQLYTSVFHTPLKDASERYEEDFAQYFGHKLSSSQPRYDLLGYDLTGYMLELLRAGAFAVPGTEYIGLQSTIHLEKSDNGGYENTHIVIERR